MSKRPNILLITSDQHRADCYGFEGRRVKTPHLDRMAANGTRFSAAITPNLVCQPARASILTGLLPLTHGSYDNRVDLDPAIGEQGWAGTLSRSGYRSAFIGKGHFGVDSSATPWGAPESRAQSADFPPDWNGPFMGFDEVELMILGHWHALLPCERPPHGQHFERWFWAHGEEGEAWRLWAEANEPQMSAAQTWHSKLPAAWHSTTWVTDRTISYLNNAKDADQPFCLWASYPDPHHSFDAPSPWSYLHHPDEVDISRTHQRDLENRPWWHRAALENEPTEKDPRVKTLREEYSRIPPQTDRQLAEMTANYYGEIAFIDDGVGRIMSTLQQSGLDEHTIVIFTSDHGDYMGDHGLYLKAPMIYEGCLRVGLLAQGPAIPAGKVVDEPVSTIDLASTFYDWADVSGGAAEHSQSLRGLIEGDNETRDLARSEWYVRSARCGVPLALNTVRTANAKLTVEKVSGDGEMYDLKNDPDEMTNLYGDPGYAAMRQELEDMIAERPANFHSELPEQPD